LLPPLHPDQQLQFLGFGGHRTSACSTRHREWAAGGPRPGGRASQLEEVRELEDKLPDTPRVHSRNSNADRSLYERNHDRGDGNEMDQATILPVKLAGTGDQFSIWTPW